MKYKLIDRQGGGLKEGNVYLTKNSVRDDLRSFHSVDVANAENMTLESLLDIGGWEIVEIVDGY